MGQQFVKGIFGSTVSSNRIKSLISPEEILENYLLIKEALSETRIIKEIGCKIDIVLKSDLKSQWVRLFYKISGVISFRLRFLPTHGKEYDEISMNLSQFYEFYDKFQHFYLILSSAKIGLSESKKIIAEEFGKIAPVQEESKMSESEGASTNAEINSATKGGDQVYDEAGLCVLCLDNSIEMMLPCYHGFCEKCCLEWYRHKGNSKCPMCRAAMTESDFNSNIFLVMSKAQEEEINQSIRDELISYLNKLCKNLKLK